MVRSIVAILGACIFMAGCANYPSTLGKVQPPENITQVFGSSKAYQVTDKFSFMQAAVLYPATAGHHRIEVGEFVLYHALKALDGQPITAASLSSFTAICTNSSNFFPSLKCPLTWEVEIQGAQPRKVRSAIDVLSSNRLLMRESSVLFIPIKLGDDVFHREIQPLLQALAEDMALKLAP